MADHRVTGTPVEKAQQALAKFDHRSETLGRSIETTIERMLADALRALLAATREDNAPESIAHEVIARRYGDYATFAWSLHPSRMQGLSAQSILNMLNEAAAAGLDSRDEF